MIAIQRAKCPNMLTGSPTEGTHYNKSGVVKTLRKMQHGKCCYCECRIPRIGLGKHVEHFRPHSRPEFKKLRNDWPNLLLACPQCNGQKGDQFPTDSRGQPLLIDPSSSNLDPEQHIEFVASVSEDPYEPIGMPIWKDGSRRGRTTIEVIALWLPDHVRARAEHYHKEVLPVYRRMVHAKRDGDDAALERAISEFNILMSSKSPLAGLVRSFARNMEVDQDFQVRIPARNE